MSDIEKEVFYADQVIAVRDALENILVHYYVFSENMSPEMKKKIDNDIAYMHKMLAAFPCLDENAAVVSVVTWMIEDM